MSFRSLLVTGKLVLTSTTKKLQETSRCRLVLRDMSVRGLLFALILVVVVFLRLQWGLCHRSGPLDLVLKTGADVVPVRPLTSTGSVTGVLLDVPVPDKSLRIVLWMCPHTCLYVSSCGCVPTPCPSFPFIFLYMCPPFPFPASFPCPFSRALGV